MGASSQKLLALLVALGSAASLTGLGSAFEDPGGTLEQMLPREESRRLKALSAPFDGEGNSEPMLVVLDGSASSWSEERIGHLRARLETLPGVRETARALKPSEQVKLPEQVGPGLRLVPLRVAGEARSLADARRLTRDLAAVLADERRAGERAYALGTPRLRADSWRMAADDLRWTLPLLALFALGLPWLFFRSLGVGLVALLLAACTNAVTLWGLCLVNGSLSPQALFVIPLLWSVATLDVLHLTGRARHLARRLPEPESWRRARRELLAPCLVTSLTTAIGLLVMGALARSGLVRELGFAGALGVLFAYALTFGLGPSLFSNVSFPAATPPWPATLGMRRLVRRARRAPRRMLVAWSLVALACLAFVPRVRVFSSFPQVFSSSTELARDMQHFATALDTDLAPLEITLAALDQERIAERDPQHDPQHDTGRDARALLTAALAVSSALHALPETRYVLPLDAVSSSSISDEVWRHGYPPQRDAALVRILEQAELETWILPERGTARVQAYLAPTTHARKGEILAELEHFGASMLSHHRLELGGPGYAAHRAETLGLADLRSGALLSTLLLGVVLCLGLRSFKLGMLALIASLLPLLCVAGLMGLASMPWSIAMLPLPAILLGIAVDDSVHMLWSVSRRTQRSAALPAILASTTMLVLCVLTLGGSSFEMNRAFGALLAVGLGIALLCDLTLLPALALRAPRRTAPR